MRKPCLPTAAVDLVQNPRYNTGFFSFVPPPGWEVLELGEKQAWVVRQIGDETVFTGEKNRAPLVYMRLIQSDKDMLDILEDMRRLVGGVTMAEPAAAPILDGVRGVGQFAEGRNDAVGFRSYLVVMPVGDKRLQMVFWGEKATWGDVATQMAIVLETMRFPGS